MFIVVDIDKVFFFIFFNQTINETKKPMSYDFQ